MLYLLHTPSPAKLPWSEAQSNSKDISCAVTDTELTWPCPSLIQLQPISLIGFSTAMLSSRWLLRAKCPSPPCCSPSAAAGSLTSATGNITARRGDSLCSRSQGKAATPMCVPGIVGKAEGGREQPKLHLSNLYIFYHHFYSFTVTFNLSNAHFPRKELRFSLFH